MDTVHDHVYIHDGAEHYTFYHTAVTAQLSIIHTRTQQTTDSTAFQELFHNYYGYISY